MKPQKDDKFIQYFVSDFPTPIGLVCHKTPLVDTTLVKMVLLKEFEPIHGTETDQSKSFDLTFIQAKLKPTQRRHLSLKHTLTSTT